MRSKRVALLLSLSAAYLLVASFLLVAEIGGPSGEVPFTTFSKGYWSGFRYGDSSYTGEYIIIRNQSAWAGFWYNHTSNIEPQPPVPTNISWNSQMVLVATQGFVRNCCASYIKFVHAEVEGETLYAYVEKVHRDGIFQSVTNPFHIIFLESVPNVVFLETSEPHERPGLTEFISLAILLFIVATIVVVALRWRPRMEPLR